MNDEIEKPTVPIADLEQRFQKYRSMFKWDKNTMVQVVDGIGKEIRQGLRHHKEPQKEDASSLALLDTCVATPATGHERGIFYAVDFGGTNLRVVRVELSENTQITQKSVNITETTRSSELPKGIMDARATATMLFDTIARCCGQFLEENGDLERAVKEGITYSCGFTFSFPMEQQDINSGVLTQWTKGFETGRDTDDKVEKADVCDLLDAAFARNDIPMRIKAVLNDTTGTLLSAVHSLQNSSSNVSRKNLRGDSRQTPACCIGLIVGTGMNACYIQRKAEDYGYKGAIINTECGNYKRFVPRNIIDRQIDCASSNFGDQMTEKLCSGLYLPEICRRAILRIYRWNAPPLCWSHRAISTAACCAAAYDETPDLAVVRCMLERQLEWKDPDRQTLEYVHQICKAVLQRSANVVACVIVALAKQTGRLQYAFGGMSVGIDGSVYIQNPGYQADIRKALNLLLEGQASLIQLHESHDGSGLGAAVLAAVESSRLGRTKSFLDF